METSDNIEINGVSYPRNKIIKFDTEAMKEKNIFDDFRNANLSHMYFEISEIDRKIILKQNFKLDKAGIFWDGAYLLTKVFLSLEKPATDLKPEKPLRILELGGSTSLPSMVAAICGHEVITTDLENVLKFMEENLEINNVRGLNIAIKPLKWGDENHMKNIQGPFDYIFASELVYQENHFEDLVKTIKYFSDENTTVILDYKLRHQGKTDLFFSYFDQYFTYTFVEGAEVLKYLPTPSLYILTAKLKKQEKVEQVENEGGI